MKNRESSLVSTFSQRNKARENTDRQRKGEVREEERKKLIGSILAS